jgi:hypothetical protein
MGRRPTQPPRPERPVLTIEQKRRGIVRLQKRIEELKAFDPQTVQRRFTDPTVKTLSTSIDEEISPIFWNDTIEYSRYKGAINLDHGPIIIGEHENINQTRQYIADGKKSSIALLEQAVRSIEEEIEEQQLGSLRDI